jgi:2-polyprenyl-6-methoxyphenol hydroxylase-like FAD-dependent oxidoreductase
MRHTDVAIAGGGLAGSLAAAMLGRAGIGAVLVDPHPVYPPDFRCEKLDNIQLETLRLTGLLDAALHVSTPDTACDVARRGRLLDRLPGQQQRGVLYETLVNAMRAQIPRSVETVHAKVAGIVTGPERQTMKLSNGEEISARLVIVATGLNLGIRQKLGMTHEVLSAGHSVSIGFDVNPTGGSAFPFSSLTYFTERPSDRAAYITLFPIGAIMRANLFVYRDLLDPWLKQFRDAPQQTLLAMWPGLRKLMGSFEVTGFVKIRPIDLFVTKNVQQNGVVLVGDAFASSCPAAGTGARKALVDVERLCNVHIPNWLATPGMGEAKIGAFYADPVKQACDALSAHKAFELRSCSIDPAVRWAAIRFVKFANRWGRGMLRSLTAPAPSPVIEDAFEDAPLPALKMDASHPGPR